MEQKISIIIPAYNADKYIAKTLDSALSQTYKNYEIIVVDDNSTDKTYQILNEYSKKHDCLKIFKNEQNQRVAKTRNIAIEKAQGQLIAFLDADDIWMPNKLEKQIEFMNHNNSKFCFSSIEFVDDRGEKINKTFHVPFKVNRKQLFKQNVITTSSVLVDAELIKKYPMHNDELHEDYICWLEILKDMDFAYGQDEVLVQYRLTDNSKSRNKFKSMRMTYKTYRFVGENWFKAHCHLVSYIFRSIKKYGRRSFK